MNKNMYDKNAKEIYNNHHKHQNMIMKVKNFFETYKIFFEIFSSVLLSIMSILISVIGIQINNRDLEINKRQLEILDSERDPHFYLLWKNEFDYDDVVGDDVYDFVIMNKGGIIKDAYVDIIDVKEYSFIDDKSFAIKIVNSDPFFHYGYNEEKKEFVIKYNTHHSDIAKISSQVSKELQQPYFVDADFHVEIHYTNYKNERKIDKYEVFCSSLILIEETKTYNCDYFIYYVPYGQSIDDMVQQIMDKINEEK